MSASRAILMGTLVLSLLAGGRARGESPDQASKVYVILVGNTKDEGIGKSVEKDLKNMENTLRAGFEKHQEQLDVKVFKGDEFTLKNVEDTISNLKTDGSETIFFYFAGHGLYVPGIGHTLAMDQPTGQKAPNILLRSDVRLRLLEKRARLTILLTDTCNSYPAGMEVRPVPTAPEWETMRCLLLVPRGLVDINSVTEGESAHGDALSGGFFTSTFTNVLREKFETLDANKDKFLHWDEIVPLLQSGTQDKYERMRRKSLSELTDDVIKGLPEDRRAQVTEFRALLNKQKTHTMRVYSLPPVARFGVRVQDNEGGGVKVLLVHEFTPAALAGLRPGDVIKQIGDHPIKDAADFFKVVDQAQGEVAVKYHRGAEIGNAAVKIAPTPVPGRDG